MSNRHEIRGSVAGGSSSTPGAVPKVRLIQMKFLLFTFFSVSDGDHQGAGLRGGTGEHVET